ncbi:ABC transporter transmembrane domain-containing protein [Thorsellia kenyensis]|uniref:ABC transporter transmembrane domain-containing protein n=1 Tax=Thorsellia kenyensis TaxID=1549888 RepID=A0ABV6C6C7_9GAMM
MTPTPTSRFFVFKTVMPFLMQEKVLVMCWLLALIGSSSATLMIPNAIREMIDHGFNETNQVNRVFLGLFLVAIFLAIATALRFFFVSLLGEKIVLSLREKLYSHLIKLDMTFHHSNQSSELVSRLAADTELIRSVIASSMSVALRSLITFLGSLILMIYTEPKLATLTIISIPIAVVPIILGAKRIRQKSKTNQDEVAAANQYAAQTLGAIYTVQAFCQENNAINQFSAALTNTFNAAKIRIFSQSIVTLLAINLIFGAIVFVLWLGAKDVINGQLSPGSLGQFVMYSLLAGTSVASLSEMMNELQKASGGMQRIAELFSVNSDLTSFPLVDAKKNSDTLAIEFNQVSFAYPIYPDKIILNSIDLSIKKGETIAIVGQSGAGKSSLFHLLLRFYDPTKGTICLNGMDIKQLSLTQLRKNFAVVSQAPDLFASSVKDNIAFGNPDASFEEIVSVAKAAEAFDFISSLPNGFDTQIGERGTQLSGGQQQRIAIARAMLKNAPILLLDEATSALDAQSEYLVQQGLDRLMEHKTTIIIAHRLSTIQNADKIIVLDKGLIVEQGIPKELLERKGVYAQLTQLQINQSIQ